MPPWPNEIQGVVNLNAASFLSVANLSADVGQESVQRFGNKRHRFVEISGRLGDNHLPHVHALDLYAAAEKVFAGMFPRIDDREVNPHFRGLAPGELVHEGLELFFGVVLDRFGFGKIVKHDSGFHVQNLLVIL